MARFGDLEAAIMDVVSAIRAQRPDAPIIFTLSPIPLLASLTDTPVVAANHISKATLRIALHNIAARNPVAGRYLRAALYRAEHTPMRRFGLSHFVVLQKREDA